MDSDNLENEFKVKEEPAEEPSEISSMLEKEIEFCSVHDIKEEYIVQNEVEPEHVNIKQEYFVQNVVIQEFAEPDYNQETGFQEETSIACTSSLTNEASFNQIKEYSKRDDEDNICVSIKSLVEKNKQSEVTNYSSFYVQATEKKESNNFVCEICGKSFSIRKHICAHLKIHKEKAYKCEICDKYLGHKNNLRKHMVTHGASSKHQCHVCKKYFGELQHLKDHLASHTDIKSFKCDICDKLFVYRNSLNRHMKVHKNIRYTCDTCGKPFIRKTYLSKHLQGHKRDTRYLCVVCKQSFSFKSALITHMKFHGGVYNCTLCGKCCARKLDLAEHMKKH